MRAIAFILSAFALASCGSGPYDISASGRDAGCLSGKYQCFAETVFQVEPALLWRRETSPAATWDDATAACSRLGENWRLPTPAELHGLVQAGVKPLIDLSAFPDTASDGYWSSATESQEARLVNFGTNVDELDIRGVFSLHVFRCVKTGR